MIKRYILVLIFSIITLLSYGQKKEFKPEWNVGVGFGPTFSSVDFQVTRLSRGPSTKNMLQYHGGVAIRYLSENHLGFIAELNYSQQGWEQNFKEDPEYAHSHQLNYLELPFMTHIYFGKKVRFIFNLGPKISFLLSDSEKMNQALADYLSSGNVPATMATHQYYRMADKKIDYGLIAGMGLEFRTAIGNFALEGRYSFGLGDIYNNTKSDVFSRSANRVISAKLTYYVKLF
ncbi:MAG: PorT family protein [Prevotella sp.]|jgi:hypothetical protein|nr:PorT family protein [Prevotella sp.]